MKRFVLLSLAVLCFAPAISVASVPNPDRTAVISALSTAPDAPPEIELQVQSPRAVPAVRSIRTAPAITAASSPITRALSAQKGSTAMHYRNGREAKNGDRIVQLDNNGKVVATGILYDAIPGNDYCNGSIAPTQPINTGACMIDCLHVDDVAAVLAEKGLEKRPEGK